MRPASTYRGARRLAAKKNRFGKWSWIGFWRNFREHFYVKGKAVVRGGH